LFSLTSCIKAINTYFPTIRIVKGRARHPQSQGFIERGNKPFKDALQDWMQDNSSENWSLGCYIVQYQMNRRSSSSRDEVVSYEAYYGWTTISEVEKTLGAAAQKIRTEVGLQLIEDVLVYLQKNHPSLIVEHETVLSIIERGDALYDGEAVLETVEEIESYDILTRRSELYNEIINDINAKNPKTLSEGDEENGSELDEEADDEDSFVSNDNNDSDQEETD